MLAVNSRVTTFRERWGFAFPKGQVALLFFLSGLGCALILTSMQQASFNSVFLLGFISVGGLVLCRNTRVRLNDPALKILGYFWLIKLGLTFFLLYAGWIPELHQTSSSISNWGYDPQRYYIQAQELIDNNWSPNLFSLKYIGILYYYGAIYYIFGHNPVNPAIINSFVTLIATLYLILVGYEIKENRSSSDWTLAFALFIPEILWYDVMTSIETLMASLLLFMLFTTGRYLAKTAPVSLFKVLIIGGLSTIAIGVIRTSMLLPVVISVGFMVVLMKPHRDSRVFQRMILAVSIAMAFIVLPAVSTNLSQYDYGEVSIFHIATPEHEWGENSIGMLLIPESLSQSILFLAPRMVLYLVAPLPYILVPVQDLLAGNWQAWENLLTLLSSIINILLIPFALASFGQSVKTRKVKAEPLIFHISYWVTFIAIAGGNLIIHPRYRVMASSLLWGCAWLGARTCSRRQIFISSLFWYGLLSLSSLFFIVYKFILV